MLTIRPCGWFVTLLRLPWLWVKVIRVFPQQATSGQYHRDRTELWLHSRGWTVIRPLQNHRIFGFWSGWTGLEIAWGRPREDDVVRYEDLYGRAEGEPIGVFTLGSG